MKILSTLSKRRKTMTKEKTMRMTSKKRKRLVKAKQQKI